LKEVEPGLATYGSRLCIPTEILSEDFGVVLGYVFGMTGLLSIQAHEIASRLIVSYGGTPFGGAEKDANEALRIMLPH